MFHMTGVFVYDLLDSVSFVMPVVHAQTLEDCWLEKLAQTSVDAAERLDVGLIQAVRDVEEQLVRERVERRRSLRRWPWSVGDGPEHRMDMARLVA